MVSETYSNQEVRTSGELRVRDWLLTMLILAVPIVNLVMLFIWAFGSPNPRKNFSKGYLLWMAICIGVALIFYIIAIIIALSFSGSSYY